MQDYSNSSALLISNGVTAVLRWASISHMLVRIHRKIVDDTKNVYNKEIKLWVFNTAVQTPLDFRMGVWRVIKV